MILLDLNSDGEGLAYADVQLFRSYISAALCFATQINATLNEVFYGLIRIVHAHWSH